MPARVEWIGDMPWVRVWVWVRVAGSGVPQHKRHGYACVRDHYCSLRSGLLAVRAACDSQGSADVTVHVRCTRRKVAVIACRS